MTDVKCGGSSIRYPRLDGNRVTAEHTKGTEPAADGVGSSKQTVPTDASAMAIDEPGSLKVEPDNSNKLQDQASVHQKP
uniref:Uncharacterized protein n=1 Tax=Oryza barthii TaxID=65489 RepID=A0A0D3GI76_9ORYZ